MSTYLPRIPYIFAGLALSLVVVLTVLPGSALVSAQQSPSDWKDTGLTLPPVTRPLCFDGAEAHVILQAVPAVGTVAYNWVTGTQQVINARPYDVCGPGGWVFVAGGPATPAWRFSLRDPGGQAIAHMPTHVAADGTLRVYALTAVGLTGKSELWSSADAGATWQDRTHQVPGSMRSLALSDADANVLYALVVEPIGAPPQQLAYNYTFSSDGGATWEERSSDGLGGINQNPPPLIGLMPVPGQTAPVSMVMKTIDNGAHSRSGARTAVFLSSDGARNFHGIGSIGADRNVQLVHTRTGLLRWTFGPLEVQTLSRSTDGGQTWQALPVPVPAQPPYHGTLAVARTAPDNVFLLAGGLWYSPDGGLHWQSFGDRAGEFLNISPYLPLAVLGGVDNHLYVLDLPAAGASLRAPALPKGTPGSATFGATGHNLSGTFQQYWRTQGGLPAQGYPLTEAFQEVSPLDGRIYTVQYFERAVFEQHPENTPPSDVLLSLLGVFSYQQRYGSTGAPRQQPNRDAARYFPETGHTIGGLFRTYWEQHGGLSQQGYPISDEFQEPNPVDGQVYTVQYFQRAVFERHPENAGTPYEVLLSLLGNAQFATKYGESQPPAP